MPGQGWKSPSACVGWSTAWKSFTTRWPNMKTGGEFGEGSLYLKLVNMEVRQAEASDVPAIVSLLKLSLGEALLPKSEEFWNWKHRFNPFGSSPVLLAIDKGAIVGVR